MSQVPCRHCGRLTEQKADEKPYCSMYCIGARRRQIGFVNVAEGRGEAE